MIQEKNSKELVREYLLDLMGQFFKSHKDTQADSIRKFIEQLDTF